MASCADCPQNDSPGQGHGFVEIIIRNQFTVDNHFEFSTKVQYREGQRLLYYLERAADADKIWRFGSSYFGAELGYSIERFNGLGGSVEDKTYWCIMDVGTDTPLPKGVSSYVPSNGQIIMFNFTTWDKPEGSPCS
ncbi:unnamed protein product [Lymnaea stagnalis]|uniref:DUF4430 domain-containing protein n=1 Tax=Lymnaea stagnalis TaxID=6523 RepID=A0AAV2IK79_LYMST